MKIYNTFKISKDKPIKGYIQLIKLAVYILGGIIAICILVGVSPWGVLSGIGAFTAILMFVFKDTILSFIASIQIISNNLFRVGDWIEAEQFGADGEVEGPAETGRYVLLKIEPRLTANGFQSDQKSWILALHVRPF